MTDFQIGLMGMVLLVILILLSMRIAYAVAIVGLLGLVLLQGWAPGTSMLGTVPVSVVGTYAYSSIPLFVLMGYFAYYSGVTDDLFDVAKTWFQHIRGGLPIATVLASAGFAAVSGSSSAATSVLGKVSIPQMDQSGVDNKLSTGVIAMGGCLAALIPPSTIMIIYGIITEKSIAAMLIAGIIPGILTVIIYILMIYIRVRINPNLAPIAPKMPWKERILSLRKTYGMILLVILVIGGIYLGIFTPTEAAGVGAFGALVLGLILRKIKLKEIKISLIETIKTSAMIFAIMIGISMFIRFLALSGLASFLKDTVTNLPVAPIYILIVMLLIYLILGMFMDAVSMMMLTLPIFFPIVDALGFHAIWFGIIVVKMAEIGLVTPPVGLNCFIVKGVAPKVPLGEIFKGVVPFIAAEFVVVAILIAFPEIVTFLPDLLKN
ncbi:TRAP transporter large permease [Bacillus dakarensis]|uniref:TRAP transporter large permease n=1 Tax=Robertmurraya dakarensis TaxID=1926278 RepID=UPI00137A68F1|nr:TRAP transporter large permease [Bacillus dakarensis]